MDFVAWKKFFLLPRRWFAVLAVYATVVGVTVAHHEPWFDEAQSWLLARDLSLPSLIFEWIRYEGTPPLWQLLLWPTTRLQLPYAALGWIGASFAVAGMFVFLRLSPFPWPVKLLLPFSYFFLYQYAAVARSYVLLPLLAFVVAALYRHAAERTISFCIALFLLANVSAHGTIISLGIAAAYAFDVRGKWPRFNPVARRRHMWAAAAYALGIFAIAAMVRTPADGNFLHEQPTGLDGAESALAGALSGHGGISALILLVCLCWCAYRMSLLSFMLPIFGLLVFFARVYVNVWHYGAITVCLVTALWIAWPSNEDRSHGNRVANWLGTGMAGMLSLIWIVQISWAAAAIRYDLRAPYSGARDAALYLKAAGADHYRIYAYGFSTVAILPYFDRQIFANQMTPENTAFWRWTKANHNDADVHLIGIDEPDYLVLAIKHPREIVENAAPPGVNSWLGDKGYSLVHISPGAIFWKTGPWETDSYLIYKNQRVP